MEKIMEKIKSGIISFVEFVKTNSLLVVFLVLALFWTYETISLWRFDREVKRADVARDAAQAKINELVLDAAKSEKVATDKFDNAVKSDKEIAISTEKVNDKKRNTSTKRNDTKRAEQNLEISGVGDIRDADVPDNDELCRRARKQGIRCDLGK